MRTDIVRFRCRCDHCTEMHRYYSWARRTKNRAAASKTSVVRPHIVVHIVAGTDTPRIKALIEGALP